MDLQTIELEQDGPVLRAWLNRPESRNAHNVTMITEVGDLFSEINRSMFDVRVVVLGGRGKTFCAGADRKESHSWIDNDRQRRYVGQLGRRAARAIEDCEAVTLARVQGHTVGGGCCFGASCDFRITADDALWYVPEVELGVPLPWSAVPRLNHELGAARARQMILTCQRVDGPLAVEWGLAHESVPETGLDAAVDRWLEVLLDKPELSTHMAKTQLRGYSRMAALGDLSETDGDLSAVASQSPAAKSRFSNFG